MQPSTHDTRVLPARRLFFLEAAQALHDLFQCRGYVERFAWRYRWRVAASEKHRTDSQRETGTHRIPLFHAANGTLIYHNAARTAFLTLRSILDVAGRLSPVLLRLPLVLTTLRIAFLIGSATVLLGVS